MVPAISYLTLLDEYVILCWLTIMLVAFEGGLVEVAFADDSGTAEAADRWCLIGIVSSWLLGHIYFAIEANSEPPEPGMKAVHVQRPAG